MMWISLIYAANFNCIRAAGRCIASVNVTWYAVCCMKCESVQAGIAVTTIQLVENGERLRRIEKVNTVNSTHSRPKYKC